MIDIARRFVCQSTSFFFYLLVLIPMGIKPPTKFHSKYSSVCSINVKYVVVEFRKGTYHICGQQMP